MKRWADFNLVCDLKRSAVTPIFKFKLALKYFSELNPAGLLLLKMNIARSGEGDLDTKRSRCRACAQNPLVQLLWGWELGTTARGWTGKGVFG